MGEPLADRRTPAPRAVNAQKRVATDSPIEDASGVEPDETSEHAVESSSFNWATFDVRAYMRAIKNDPLPTKCPVPGCFKSYMSLNGVEYHLRHHGGPGLGRELDASLNASTIGSLSLRSSLNNSASGPTPGSASRKRKRGRSSIRPTDTAEGTPINWASPLVAPSARHQVPISALRFVDIELDGSVNQLDITHRTEVVRIDRDDDISAKPQPVVKVASASASAEPSPAVSLAPGQMSLTSSAPAGMLSFSFPTPLSEFPKDWFDVKGDFLASERLTLPAAVVKIMSEASGNVSDSRPASYYRYIDKSAEELDSTVEYDMDEEDSEWLAIINGRRVDAGLKAVPPTVFELLMDRLEKESCFLSQAQGRHPAPPTDDDAVCCVCKDGESDNTNAIIFCDACNIPVHQDCYGVPYIPEGQWLCRRCLASPSRGVDCLLCPNKGGAFKQTNDGRWAHVACAVWVPETSFANAVYLEPIDGVDDIPKARWKLTCYICRRREGACIQCSKTNCYAAFHVTCAQEAGTFMEIHHESNVEFPTKTAYCAEHSPADDSAPMGGRTQAHDSLGDVVGNDDEDDEGDDHGEAQRRRKRRLRNARKILQDDPEMPVVSVPVVPVHRLAKIVGRLSIEKKAQFVQKVQAYWKLKRQSRCGVPLIRRLQITHQRPANADTRTGDPVSDTPDDVDVQRLKWQRLRQDLERVRLLVEQVRKREKQKREGIRVAQQILELCVDPRQPIIRRIVTRLQDLDYKGFFSQPVPIQYVPDYLDVVSHPMDLGTMAHKAERCEYDDLHGVAEDLRLVCENAILYNAHDTPYYKAAVRLRDQAVGVFEEGGQLLAECEIAVDTLYGEADVADIVLPLFPSSMVATETTNKTGGNAVTEGGDDATMGANGGDGSSGSGSASESEDSDSESDSSSDSSESSSSSSHVKPVPADGESTKPSADALILDSKLTSRGRLPVGGTTFGMWDVVWAKCRGFPWYPAVLVDVDLFGATKKYDADRFTHLPSMEVMGLRDKQPPGSALVMFFDSKRTWQWLTIDRIAPLGPESVDSVKLRDSSKPSARKAVALSHAAALEYAASPERELHLQESEKLRGIVHMQQQTPSRTRRGQTLPGGGAGLGKGKIPPSHHGTPVRVGGAMDSAPSTQHGKEKAAASGSAAKLGLRTISDDMVRVASAVAAKNTSKRKREDRVVLVTPPRNDSESSDADGGGDAGADTDSGEDESDEEGDVDVSSGNNDEEEEEDGDGDAVSAHKRMRTTQKAEGLCVRNELCMKDDGHIGRCLTKDTRGALRAAALARKKKLARKR